MSYLPTRVHDRACFTSPSVCVQRCIGPLWLRQTDIRRDRNNPRRLFSPVKNDSPMSLRRALRDHRRVTARQRRWRRRLLLLALGNRGSAVRITFGGTRQGRGGEGRTGRERAGPNREQNKRTKKEGWGGSVSLHRPHRTLALRRSRRAWPRRPW